MAVTSFDVEKKLASCKGMRSATENSSKIEVSMNAEHFRVQICEFYASDEGKVVLIPMKDEVVTVETKGVTVKGGSLSLREGD